MKSNIAESREGRRLSSALSADVALDPGSPPSGSPTHTRPPSPTPPRPVTPCTVGGVRQKKKKKRVCVYGYVCVCVCARAEAAWSCPRYLFL